MTNVSNLASKMLQLETLDVLAINDNLAVNGVIEPLDQLDSGALARARSSNNRCCLSSLECPREVSNYLLIWAARIAEVDVLKADFSFKVMSFSLRIIDINQRFTIDDIEAALCSSLSSDYCLDIWADASKSHDSEQDTEEARDDVPGRIGPVMGVIPEALIDPDGAQGERIGVPKVNSRHEGRKRSHS